MLLKAFFVATGFKLILVPAYRSTDFEVHRNWLAITHSLPLEQWYVESTSEWTLDYPPLFAWFQYLLSLIAYFFDKDMLRVSNINYTSPYTVIFMRASVMLADVSLLLGCREITDFLVRNPLRKCSRWKSMWTSPVTVFYVLILINMGLFIVDHIHFQYNGVLFGILLISIGKILKEEYVWGAFWFAVLLNMKHIFLYMAPAYGIYLLRNYCLFDNKERLTKSVVIKRVLNLAAVVTIVTVLSFGPFVLIGQTTQVLKRLFPFKRGLCHAYWAPNMWALYNVADKILLHLTRKVPHLRPITHQSFQGSMTSGILQNYEHIFLPTITPTVTAILVLVTILPCLWKLWMSPGNPLHFVRSVIICTSCSFLFGWHVHEKAIMMVLIPLSLMAVLLRQEAEVFTLLSIIGHYSLLPLLFTSHEFLIKASLLVISSYYTIHALSNLFQVNSGGIIKILNFKENVYVSGLIVIFFYEHIIHKARGLDKKYPFMPLLLTSCYCALGIVYCTIKYYYNFLIMHRSEHKQKTF